MLTSKLAGSEATKYLLVPPVFACFVVSAASVIRLLFGWLLEALLAELLTATTGGEDRGRGCHAPGDDQGTPAGKASVQGASPVGFCHDIPPTGLQTLALP